MPTPNPLPEPGELAAAIRVGQKMLARYGTVDSGDIFAYAQAHGGLTEALRILLRAVGAEPDAEPDQVRHANGLAFKVIPADSPDARIARNVRPLTMADGTEWTVGAPVGWFGIEAAWRPAPDPDDEPEIADSGKIAMRGRCPAAHPDDPTPCDGSAVVTVLDAANAGVDGCEHHGARLVASLDQARVYALPDAPEGAAIRVFKAADTTRPFPWVDGPRTRDDQLSHAETRGRGERP